MKSFAIVLVCYKRLSGIQRLLKSLEVVDYSGRNDITLIFSIDNSGDTTVADYANSYIWPHGNKIVRTFPERQGLKKHILKCGDYTNQFDIISVLEDDIFVSNSFYHYAYNAAVFYEFEDRVAGISLYSFQKNWLDWIMRFEPQRTGCDAYFMRIAQSWGQVWIKEKWDKFLAWYGKNQNFNYSEKIPEYLNGWPESSWLKYHTRYCIETDRYFVYPYVSLSTNFSDAGEHADVTVNDHQVELMINKEKYSFPVFSKNAVIYDEYCNRCGLSRYLDVNEWELTVDFWGTKRKSMYSRYVLTACSLDYKEIASFALSLRPIEMAVIYGIPGKGITLYDTSESGVSKKNTRFDLLLYSLRSHDIKTFLPFCIKLFFKELKRTLHRRLKRLMHRG